ncbi:MAG: hypothetical protein AB1500_08735 [Bacillota bacterium]
MCIRQSGGWVYVSVPLVRAWPLYGMAAAGKQNFLLRVSGASERERSVRDTIDVIDGVWHSWCQNRLRKRWTILSSTFLMFL